MKPLQVSNNLLQAKAKCSTMTVLRYGLNRQGTNESAALKSGSAGHTALEVFWKGGTRKEALRALRLEYKEWAEANIDPDDKYQGRFSWENVRRVVGYYLERFPIENLPFTIDPNMVEVSFAIPLTKKGDIELIGIMDAANVRDKQSKRIWGVDHKFTGGIASPWFLPQFRMGSQMTGYLWAMREMTPEKVIGMYVNAIQLSKLPYTQTPERKCKDHGIPYQECWIEHIVTQLISVERTEEQIKSWRLDAIDLARDFMELLDRYPDAEQINQVPQEGKFNGSCSMCDYAEFCYAGRPVDRLNTMTGAREERAEWRV
jgi:hypothetical protein